MYYKKNKPIVMKRKMKTTINSTGRSDRRKQLLRRVMELRKLKRATATAVKKLKIAILKKHRQFTEKFLIHVNTAKVRMYMALLSWNVLRAYGKITIKLFLYVSTKFLFTERTSQKRETQFSSMLWLRRDHTQKSKLKTKTSKLKGNLKAELLDSI